MEGDGTALFNTYIDKLAVHGFRDNVIRNLGYFCALLAARGKPDSGLAVRAGILKGLFSSTRTVLRMFDDLPMWKYAIEYGLGSNTEHPLYRVLMVLENAIYSIYYPVEHIALLSQLKVIRSLDASRWSGWCTILWTFGLLSSIIRNVHAYLLIQKKNQVLIKRQRHSDTQQVPTTSEVKSLRSQGRQLLLDIIKSTCDLMNAVHWLPLQILWANRLTGTQSAIFGIIASLIGFYQRLKT